MRKIKAILCAVLSACIIACPLAVSSVPAGAADINSLEDKLDELNRKESEYQKTLDKTQSDINEKEKYSEALVGKIEVLTKKITVANQSIDKLNEEIGVKQDAIERGNKNIEGQLDALCERLKAIYKAGSASDLEIVLGAKDLSDFIDKINLVKTVAGIDQELIDEINDKLTVINKQKSELEGDKAKLDKEKEGLQTDLDNLNKTLDENQELLNTLYSENDSARSKLQSLSGQASSVEKEIAAYWEEYRKAQASASGGGIVDVSEQVKRTEERRQQKQQQATTPTQPVTKPTTPAPTEPEPEPDPEPTVEPDPVPVSTGYVWPCPSCYILTSEWNEDRTTYNHGAIDIGCGYGSTIVAADYGTVVDTCTYCIHNWGKSGSCGCGGGYGNYVWIDHGNGKETIYAHLQDVVVNVGDSVTPGEVIGYSGSTGYSTGPHLHFECRYEGVKYNPMSEY